MNETVLTGSAAEQEPGRDLAIVEHDVPATNGPLKTGGTEAVEPAVASGVQGPRDEPAPSATQLFGPSVEQDKSVVRKLNKWSQGCLVPGLRLLWGSPDGDDPIVGETADGSEPNSWWVSEYDEPASCEHPGDSSGRRLGIITSQSCDIVLTGVGAEHAVVQVSPVVRAEDHFPNKIAEIRRQMIGYLVLLDNVPSSPEGAYDPEREELADGTWVADLRISLPVSKAVLLGTKARSAFRELQRAIEFGEVCAAKIRRPSWHEELAETFPREINKTIETSRKERDEAWLGPVEQVRLQLLEGSKLEPVKVAPLIIFDSDFPPEYRERWIEVLGEAGRKITKSIEVVTAKVFDLNKMPVKDYRESSPLLLPSLARPPYW